MQNSNMNSSSGTSTMQQKQALANLKNEVAKEVGVNLKQGYNGDITSREAGQIAGYMTKKVIEEMQNSLKYMISFEKSQEKAQSQGPFLFLVDRFVIERYNSNNNFVI